jgi:hypothetical protein
MEARLEAALDPETEKRVEWSDLLWLSRWRSLDDEAESAKRDVAETHYLEAVSAFKASHGPGCRIGLFGVGGVLLPGVGERLQVTWQFGAIEFDSSDARALVDRVDAITDAALEWWPDEDADARLTESRRAQRSEESPSAAELQGAGAGKGAPGPDQVGSKEGHRRPRLRGRLTSLASRSRRPPALNREPHLSRAYDLATGVVAAVANEQTRHRQAEQKASESATSGSPGTKRPDPDAVSDFYKRDLSELAQRIQRAELLLDAAGQRTAQARYVRGMFRGAVLLGLATLITGAAFLAFDVEAKYGVGIPAGGLGAVVSVFQRMASRSFRLDIEAISDLALFGAARPFIGAVFGVLIVCLLEAGLLDIYPGDGSTLALYAVLGFFAGFNERFARDTLSSSADPTGLAAGSAAGATPGSQA